MPVVGIMLISVKLHNQFVSMILCMLTTIMTEMYQRCSLIISDNSLTFAERQGGIRSEMNTLEGQQEWYKRPRKLQKND